MKSLRFASILAGVFAAAMASQSFGASINIVGSKPDVFNDAGSITYTAASHTFNVTGTAEFITTGGGQTPITGGVFSLTAVLNKISGSGPSDVFSTLSGSLSVTGNGGTTFFSSNTLVDFGFSTVAGSDNFQFIFSNGSGTLAVPGGKIAVQLQGQGGTTYAASTTGLDADFSEIFLPTATADVFNVTPLPASCWGGISLIAILGMAELRRRKVLQA